MKTQKESNGTVKCDRNDLIGAAYALKRVQATRDEIARANGTA